MLCIRFRKSPCGLKTVMPCTMTTSCNSFVEPVYAGLPSDTAIGGRSGFKRVSPAAQPCPVCMLFPTHGPQLAAGS